MGDDQQREWARIRCTMAAALIAAGLAVAPCRAGVQTSGAKGTPWASRCTASSARASSRPDPRGQLPRHQQQQGQLPVLRGRDQLHQVDRRPPAPRHPALRAGPGDHRELRRQGRLVLPRLPLRRLARRARRAGEDPVRPLQRGERHRLGAGARPAPAVALPAAEQQLPARPDGRRGLRVPAPWGHRGASITACTAARSSSTRRRHRRPAPSPPTASRCPTLGVRGRLMWETPLDGLRLGGSVQGVKDRHRAQRRDDDHRRLHRGRPRGRVDRVRSARLAAIGRIQPVGGQVAKRTCPWFPSSRPPPSACMQMARRTA